MVEKVNRYKMNLEPIFVRRSVVFVEGSLRKNIEGFRWGTARLRMNRKVRRTRFRVYMMLKEMLCGLISVLADPVIHSE